jgi:hypothetical protein
LNGVTCDLPKSDNCRIMSDKSSPLPLALFLKARFNIYYRHTGAVFLLMHATASAHLMVFNFATVINLLLVERMLKSESCFVEPHMTSYLSCISLKSFCGASLRLLCQPHNLFFYLARFCLSFRNCDAELADLFENPFCAWRLKVFRLEFNPSRLS